MENWYSKDLGDGIEAFLPTTQIQEIFVNFFSAAGLPKEMAIFFRYDLERNIVTAYLTPACHTVAMAIGAERCEKPDRQSLSLLVGDARAWQVFYPVG
jgi:hypothetical protein